MKWLIPSVLVIGCVAGLAALPPVDDPPRFSAWSAPVMLGSAVNSTDGREAGAFISKDGLSLYFGSTRPIAGATGTFDIWVSQRDSLDDPWEPAKKLGPTINTGCNEQTPTLSVDGHWLFFARDCGGFGKQDIFVSRRQDKRDDFGWGAAVNLGSGVNGPENESCPAPFQDDETMILYFSSDRLTPGTEDIFVSTMREGEPFGPAELVGELSTAVRDSRPSVWKNGLVLYLDSNRPGSLGGNDLWVSTRERTSDPWSTPENVGAVNSSALDARPVLSFNGTELYFHSGRGVGGLNHIYVSTRTKIKGHD